MTREQFDEAKRHFEEVSALLKAGNLSAEERAKFEMLKTQLAGTLHSSWLPFSWWRRVVMLVLLLLGLLWPLGGSAVWVVAWLAMLLFSPRVVGEVAFAFSRFAAGSKDGGPQ